MTKPRISIVLPLYNGASYIQETMDSLLEQSFSDFELIVVDDASTDDSGKKVLRYRDSRIRYERNTHNLGMAHTRNRGLKLARGDVVVMSDQDDISMPDRLLLQYQYLHDHPECMLVGGWSRHFGGARGIYRYVTDYAKIRMRMLGDSQFSHPSVAFRRKLVVEHGLRYEQDYAPADDYRLLAQITARFPVANIPHEIIRYRVHDRQHSQTSADLLVQRADRVRVAYLEQILSMRLNDAQARLHAQALYPRAVDKETFLLQVAWLLQLLDRARGVFDTRELQNYFVERLVGTLRRSAPSMGWQAVRLAGKLPGEFKDVKNSRPAITRALFRARGRSLLNRARMG